MINQKKSPYHGTVLTAAIMCLPSVFATWILYKVMSSVQPTTAIEIHISTAKFIGCGVGVLFHLSCLIAGVFKEPFGVVKKRVRNFFEYLTPVPSVAFKLYFDDLKTEGAEFWIYFAIFVANVSVTADGLLDFLALI